MNIFVFGSNRLGVHSASGGAREAHAHYGAVYGRGEGLAGQSYAIPTKKTPHVSLPLEEVAVGIERFKRFAHDHREHEFHLTRVGCGLEGFTDEQIAPYFRDSPPNVHLPDRWTGLLST
jgi:hypothetical protein